MLQCKKGAVNKCEDWVSCSVECVNNHGHLVCDNELCGHGSTSYTHFDATKQHVYLCMHIYTEIIEKIFILVSDY